MTKLDPGKTSAPKLCNRYFVSLEHNIPGRGAHRRLGAGLIAPIARCGASINGSPNLERTRFANFSDIAHHIFDEILNLTYCPRNELSSASDRKSIQLSAPVA